MQALQIERGLPAAVDACLPGGSCAASFRVTNPNAVPLEVYEVLNATGPGTSFGYNDGSSAGCPVEHLGVNGHVLSTPQPVPPGTSNVRVANTFTLDSAAPTACQGKGFFKLLTLRARTP